MPGRPTVASATAPVRLGKPFDPCSAIRIIRIRDVVAFGWTGLLPRTRCSLVRTSRQLAPVMSTNGHCRTRELFRCGQGRVPSLELRGRARVSRSANLQAAWPPDQLRPKPSGWPRPPSRERVPARRPSTSSGVPPFRCSARGARTVSLNHTLHATCSCQRTARGRDRVTFLAPSSVPAPPRTTTVCQFRASTSLTCAAGTRSTRCSRAESTPGATPTTRIPHRCPRSAPCCSPCPPHRRPPWWIVPPLQCDCVLRAPAGSPAPSTRSPTGAEFRPTPMPGAAVIAEPFRPVSAVHVTARKSSTTCLTRSASGAEPPVPETDAFRVAPAAGVRSRALRRTPRARRVPRDRWPLSALPRPSERSPQ